MKRLHIWMAVAVMALILSSAPAISQNANEIIKSTSNGLFWFGGNEARSDAKDLDASKVRVGSRMVPGQHGGGGAFTFDGLMTNDTSDAGIQRARRVEVAGIGGSFNGRTGEVGMWIWNGRDPNDIRDADQVKVIEFFSDHIEIKVPVRGLTVQGGGQTDRMTSLDGRFVTVQQGEDRKSVV